MGSKGSVFYNTYVCQTQTQTTPWNMEAWPEERLISNLPKFLILTIITKNQEKSDLRIIHSVSKLSKNVSFNQTLVNGVHPRISLALESIIPKSSKIPDEDSSNVNFSVKIQIDFSVIKWDFLNDFQTVV